MIKLSYSAAQKYLDSPMSYFLHYFLRLRPIGLSSALIFGAAVDSAINSLLEDKKNNRTIDIISAIGIFDVVFSFQDGKDLWPPGVIKFNKSDLDESLLNDEDLENEEADPSWLSMRRKGHIIIEEYAKQVLPKIKEVYLVQHEISLVNELGDTFTGVVDFLCKWEDDKIYIVDNKTTSVKYKEDAADGSEQLATYYEALKDEYEIDGVLYITIPKKVRKKKMPAVEMGYVFGSISEELTERTFENYDQVLNGIKRGEFQCSRKCCEKPWPCPYKGYCDSGGKDMTGLVYVKEKK